MASSAFAGDATWTNLTSSTWTNVVNWDTGVPPGATNGATSPDTATFYGAGLTASSTVTVDTGRNVQNILFTNSTAGFTFALSSGSLVLSAGGKVELTGTAIQNISTTVNPPITLAGSYSFLNNGGNLAPVNNPLIFNGSISGVASIGAITLTIGGTNGNLGGKAILQTGVVSDGTGNTLSVVKQDSGFWQMNGINTFTGGLVVKQGTLIIGNNRGLGGNGLGAVTLGDSATGQDARISLGSSINVTNPIAVASGSGNRVLANNGGSGNGTYVGIITLNNDLTLTALSTSSGRSLIVSGSIGGTGNVIAKNAGAFANNLLTVSGSLNNSGALTNASITGDVNVSGVIGANVTRVVQDSATSLLTLSSAANTYTASTLVNAGTLTLGATASIASSTNIAVASGATFNVSLVTGGYILASGQTLQGEGNVNGNVATAIGSTISPAGNGVAGTLTFNNNLNTSAGGTNVLDVSTSSGGGNDSVSVGGTLTAGGILKLNALSGAANLDTTADYVLINAGSISGSFASTPSWAGTAPANAANFSIVTTGTQVLLHYNTDVPPTVTATADPASTTRTQNTTLTAVVTPGNAAPGSAISTVTVDLTAIGGSPTSSLVLSNNNVWTNTFTVGTGSTLGTSPLTVTATAVNALQGSFAISFTVLTTQEIWNGAGANDDWGTAGNWTSGVSPLTADDIFFVGLTRTTPNLEANYSITGLTFNSGAASFNIGTANASTLMVTGAITNNSANAQTLTVPLALNGTGALPINAAAGDLTLAGAVSDSGSGLIKSGSSNLTLSAANTYTGTTVISNGTLTVSGSGTLGGGAANLNVASTSSALNLGGTSQTVGSVTVSGGVISNGSLTATFYGMNGGIVSADLAGVGAGLNKSTTNTLILSGNNSFSGTVQIFNSSAGLCINSPTALGTGTVDISLGGNGGSFDCTSSVAISNANNNAMSISGDFTFVGSQSLNLGTGSANMGTSFPKTINVAANTLEIGGNIFSGGAQPLSKAGAGTLILSGNSTYFGATLVKAGTLLVNGSLDGGGLSVTVSNAATLGGTGTISRPVIVDAGGTLSPGASIGTLTVSSDLTLFGNLFIEVNKALVVSNDTVSVSGVLTNLGTGTVTVTNLNPGQPLVVGDSFQLFSQPLPGGETLTISPAPGAGLAWTNKLALDGTIAVVTGVATNPTNITATVSGGSLVLSWPTDHLGWSLQVQTNSLSTGLGTNWVTVPGSASVTSVTNVIDAANGSVFYRLTY